MMVLTAALLLASGLYEQVVERVLAARFPDVEYIAMNAQTKQVIATNWPDPAEPIPAGSLTKPLLAVELPADREFTCRKGCWVRGGHGRLNLREAIAFSCNQYFLQSAAGTDVATLIGLQGDFRIAPLALARDYLDIVRDRKPIREGMHLAVVRGTARALNADALAKTGTTRCSHMPRGPGDGLVVVLWPSAEPKWLLLVRAHGTTGAVAAATAGQMLHVIDDAR